jgi:hypothetical protein
VAHDAPAPAGWPQAEQTLFSCDRPPTLRDNASGSDTGLRAGLARESCADELSGVLCLPDLAARRLADSYKVHRARSANGFCAPARIAQTRPRLPCIIRFDCALVNGAKNNLALSDRADSACLSAIISRLQSSA